MHRLLERFSAFASTAVVFVYLGGLFLGTATYFAGKAIGVDVQAAAVTAFALAAAFEVHSFLSQRLTRFWFQARAKLDASQPEWDTADQQFRVHLWITVALVVFSAFNSVAFWALVLHPGDTGSWLQCLVRGAVTPAAFLAAGFLTPLQHDASQMLAGASTTMLRKAVKITIRQWTRRLEAARKSGINLAPMAATLMEDAHETAAARRLRIIDDALCAAESGNAGRAITAPALASAPAGILAASQEGAGVAAEARTEHASVPPEGVQVPLQPHGEHPAEPPQRPPTGPGSPAAGKGANGRSSRADRSPVLRLEPVPEWRRAGRREAAQGRANGRGVRTPSGAGGRRRQVATDTVEEQVRAAWQPGMSVTQLERAAGISRNAAGKWRKVLMAEAEASAAQLAR